MNSLNSMSILTMGLRWFDLNLQTAKEAEPCDRLGYKPFPQRFGGRRTLLAGPSACSLFNLLHADLTWRPDGPISGSPRWTVRSSPLSAECFWTYPAPRNRRDIGGVRLRGVLTAAELEHRNERIID